jgi:hypothetical protein
MRRKAVDISLFLAVVFIIEPRKARFKHTGHPDRSWEEKVASWNQTKHKRFSRVLSIYPQTPNSEIP